jgi:hypothetical protein
MAIHPIPQKRNSCIPAHAALFAFLLLFLTFFVLPKTIGATEPVALNDSEMAAVTGQSGLTILAKGLANISASVVKFSDANGTSPHWIEFRNFTIDDGKGGYFNFDTPWVITDTYMNLDPTTIDVYTGSTGQTFVLWRDTMHVMPRWYSVGDFVFCDQSLGSLNLDALTMGPNLMRFGSHADGTVGIDFDIRTQINAQAFRYTYNTSPEALTLSGIHLVGSATGANDNPADPSTWSFTVTKNVFVKGNMSAGKPATMYVGTDRLRAPLPFISICPWKEASGWKTSTSAETISDPSPSTVSRSIGCLSR